MKKRILIAWLLLFAMLLGACGGNPSAGGETTESTVAALDPGEDGVLNVLLIGNSFGYGFGKELAAMLQAADVKANIYSVYYPSATVKMHLNWSKKEGGVNILRKHSPDGNNIDIQDVSLQYCLSQQNWDVISLQTHFIPAICTDFDTAMKECSPAAGKLFDWLREQFPKSHLAWYETWTFSVGWEGGNIVMDEAYQKNSQQVINQVSQALAKECGVGLVPCGEAWAIARATPNIGQLHRGDKCHDGPAGGYYLNACVWYEYLTGLSCLENTWIPGDGLGYSIEAEKVLMIRNAAHQAVSENQFFWNKGE